MSDIRNTFDTRPQDNRLVWSRDILEKACGRTDGDAVTQDGATCENCNDDCKLEEIDYDQWSVDLQQWVLVDVHDGTFYKACEGECPAVMTSEEIRARIAREVEEHQFFQQARPDPVANPVSSAQDDLDQRMDAQSKAALARKPGEKCGQEGCSVCDPQEDV